MLVDVNLLPKRERKTQLFLILIYGFFFIWLIVAIVFAVNYMKSTSTLEKTIEQKEVLVQNRQLLEQELLIVQAEQTESLESIVTFAERLLVPTSLLIDQLVDDLPETGYLNQYSYSNGTTTIQTQVETMEEIAAYIVKLNQSPFLEDVRVNTVTTFDHTINQEEKPFESVPRYTITYTLTVDREALVKEDKNNE
ncbi:PilN domain-containing protein [Alkalihalobacillus sp. LMS39]|uniref:PilN domain-containing protein n=1 Tax=Alkalihalobacillus sp. LMS39 TaxID=2924032 RepID=UPI001FB2113E|nr:PilN domain-containing protein [Alkalihalobacillus sp. LMS39]UOE93307.1 PilN domain-containing protein [Alkalihalobacillus sp. LMS39]